MGSAPTQSLGICRGQINVVAAENQEEVEESRKGLGTFVLDVDMVHLPGMPHGLSRTRTALSLYSVRIVMNASVRNR